MPGSRIFLRRLVLTAFFLSPAGARAAGSSVQSTDFVGLNVCQCSANALCWKVVMHVNGDIVAGRLAEIEAAMPNRFFPQSSATALLQADSHGNFLSVRCGPNGTPCDDQRDELEKRVIYSSFLESLPSHPRGGVLFDPETWAITEKGEKLMKRARRCRPTLMRELGKAVLKRAGRHPNDLPGPSTGAP